MLKPERALVSVSDKEGIVEFVKELQRLNIEIISTGGTYKKLKENGIKVIEISEITNFPEILDGRVKTLHPFIHGGLLARRDKDEHINKIKELGIKPIDMVVVNLYPFKEVIKKENISMEEVIENIDIGGPSMIRSAAKNHTSVAVITDKNDYIKIINEIKNGGIKDTTLKELAVKAYKLTADYDIFISNYLEKHLLEKKELPDKVLISVDKKQTLRYGENPHQKGAFYVFENVKGVSPGNLKQLHGKELSFNNIYDIDAAINIIKEFKEPAAVVIKHANPCGVAVSSDITDAYIKAFDADSLSAFGGIVAINRECTKEIAEKISKVFIEVIIAPSFNQEALNILKQKKNLRIMEAGEISSYYEDDLKYMDIRKVNGGFLIQDMDIKEVTKNDLKVVTKTKLDDKDIEELLFAYKVVKHVKSNAIVISKDRVAIGVGPGQTSRVGALEIAIKKAGDNVKGAYLASDAFFPFRDSIDTAAKYGIKAIIQPGGSIRDDEVIKAADEHNIIMVFTGIRHFKH